MTKYAQNGGLTRFDTGGTHSQNPNGGVNIGNNNSVEENETKQNNFVYSNRIFLDANTVSQYNLPKSLIGKSVADASKLIDNKFKGRNDKISQSTKNSMLSKVAEAQESMKPPEPEIEQPQEQQEQPQPEMQQQSIPQNNQNDQQQMAFGGYTKKFDVGGFAQYGLDPNIGIGYNYKPTGMTSNSVLTQPSILTNGQGTTGTGDLTGGSSVGGISTGGVVSAATTALDLGKVAFGKPAQDTSGLNASTEVNKGNIITGSAMKGAQTGMAFGPWGAAAGAVIGAGAGILGANKAKHAALTNSNNFALNTNRKFSDQYALGGNLMSGDPTLITKDNLANTTIIPGANISNQSDRFRYAVGEQGGIQHSSSGEQGHYLYYGKKPGDSGFNPNVNREFVNQGGYDTYMKSPQGQQYRHNLQTQTTQPIEQFAMGGKTNQMYNGGDYYENNKPYFMTNPGTILGPNNQLNNNQTNNGYYEDLKLTPRNTAPIESVNNLKSAITTVPYTIGTQPTVNISNVNKQFTPGPSNLDILKYNTGKVGDYVNQNAGNIARYAPIAANAFQLSQLKKPQGERLDRLSNRYKPEYVDEASLQNIANNSMNNSVSAIGQSGASQGQLRSSIIGSQLQRTKAISDAYSQAAVQNRATNDRAQQFNLGIDQVNLQQSNNELDINDRNSAAYRNEKSKYISAIGNDVGDVGKEQVEKKIIAKTTGYKWDGEYVKSPDGNIVTDPDTKKPMTIDKLKQLQSSGTVKQQALGGYLIKNKVK